MNDLELFDSLPSTRQAMLESIGRVVVGQNDVVEMMLTALFSNGHCLFVGVPVGKDPFGSDGCNHARLLLWSRSVYARPDAIRHHWY